MEEAWSLEPAVAERLDEHARAGRPLETCGYLIGRRPGHAGSRRRVGRITGFEPTGNLHDQAATRYTVDPLVFLELEDRLEDSDDEVVGIFHSHPESSPEPSATDREHAQPGWVYLILGFPPERPDGWLRAWTVAASDAPFTEADLNTLETP